MFNEHQFLSDVTVHDLLVVNGIVRVLPFASAVKLLSFSVILSSSLLACFTVAVAFAVPAFMVILAVRSSVVGLASIVTCKFIVPACPCIFQPDIHQLLSDETLHVWLVVNLIVMASPSALAVKLLSFSVILSSSLFACFTVAVALAVPALMVIFAVRSLVVGLASNVKLMVILLALPYDLSNLHQF